MNSDFTAFCLSDLKRNDYTPDKVTFPQEDPPNPGGGVRESRPSLRLMLWVIWTCAGAGEALFFFFFFLSQSQGAEEHGQSTGRISPCLHESMHAHTGVCVGPTRMLCQTQFTAFLCFYVNEEKSILYVCMWTGYMDRYSAIAKGLLFIMKFEKLPCLKKQFWSALCIYLSRRLSWVTAMLQFATTSLL